MEATKVSEITYNDVAEYLRLDETDGADQITLTNLIGIAKSFIIGYTGQTEEALDDFPDFVIVVLVLCQDMWDNRTLYVNNQNLNRVVETILGMHSVNLL